MNNTEFREDINQLIIHYVGITHHFNDLSQIQLLAENLRTIFWRSYDDEST